MTSIRSSLLLILAPMFMSVNAAAGAAAAAAAATASSRRCFLVPFFSSMQCSTPITVNPTAFLYTRTCISMLRGGGAEQEENNDTDHDRASRHDDLSDRQESKVDIKEEGDAWEEVIRNTKEYYSSVSQSSKSSSSSSSSKLITRPNIQASSSTTVTTTLAPTTPSPTTTINTTNTTTTTNTNTSTRNGEVEDERVFCVSLDVYENGLRNNGEGGYANGDGDKYSTSKTLIGQDERSGSMDDGILSTIHDDSDNLDIVLEGNKARIEPDKIGEAAEGISCGNDDEDASQEILAPDGFIPCQVESNEQIIQDGIDGDHVNGRTVSRLDLPASAVFDLETSLDADKQKMILGESIGTQINKDFVETNNIEEVNNHETYSETPVTTVNDEFLVFDDEKDGRTTNDKTLPMKEFRDSNNGVDAVPRAVEAANANKGVALQLIRKLQRRISTLMMTGRRKAFRHTILVSLGVAFSLLLNSFCVAQNASSDSAERAIELPSNDDVLAYSNTEPPNIEEDEDSDSTAPSTLMQDNDDLERTWLDQLLSFVDPQSRA